MSTDFNLNEFLTNDLGFTAEEIEASKPLFTDERTQKLKGSVLRQTDYSKRMDALKEEYAEKEEALVAQARQIAKIKDDSERAVAEAKYETEVLKLQHAKAKELYGVPDLEVEPPAKPEKKKEEPAGMSREEATEVASSTLKVQAILSDIREEYKELYPGQRFNAAEFMEKVEANARKGVNIFATAEAEFKFSEIRRKREVDAAVKRATEENDEKWRQRVSNEQLSTLPREGDEGSPLLKNLRNKDAARVPGAGRQKAMDYINNRRAPGAQT